MKLASLLLSRALDLLDALFDALAAILRVLFRGAFAPDAKSYRGPRFAPLGDDDVLVQEIALNAGDASQARKAIALDPERHLPLSLDAAVFDVVGPIDAPAEVRARPERRYIVGLVRTEALTRLRTALPSGRRGAVEAFKHAPAAHPAQALVFRDAAGNKRRRTRRILLALALLAFVVTGAEALDAGRGALDSAVAAAESERVMAERRIRLAERRAASAREALAALQTPESPTLATLSARLSRLAAHQPPKTETLSVEIDGPRIRIAGRTHEPLEAELALRRAFEGETIVFTADTETPATFSAELGPSLAQEAQR